MNFLKGLNIFSKGDVYYISFQDVTGLASSSPIYADGYPVGTVRSIDYDYTHEGKTKVTIDIEPEMRIPKGSSAVIESDMLGNVQVNLLLGDDRTRLIQPGSTLQGEVSEGALGQVKKMIPTIEKMLPKLDSIMASVNTLLADPAIAQSLHNVEHVTASLNTSTRELNTLMAQLNRDVPGMTQRANKLMDNTNAMVENLNKVDVEQTMRKVNSTLDNVEQFTAQLNSNNGSLGLLMRDQSLYNNLNATMLSADSLLTNLREHPKRYVHFSVFGKKDK
jgi:phospholipid/cholesterol/gamma-HCH transport system substrate-binding protein